MFRSRSKKISLGLLLLEQEICFVRYLTSTLIMTQNISKTFFKHQIVMNSHYNYICFSRGPKFLDPENRRLDSKAMVIRRSKTQRITFASHRIVPQRDQRISQKNTRRAPELILEKVQPLVAHKLILCPWAISVYIELQRPFEIRLTCANMNFSANILK